MNTSPSTSPPEPPDCDAAFERMPWMINGSLAPDEARLLEAHVASCPRCRARLDAERDLFRAIRRPLDNVEQAPLAAWGRFEAALGAANSADGRAAAAANDALLAPSAEVRQAAAAGADCAAPQAAAPDGASRPARGVASGRRRLRLALLLQAASIAVLSVAVLWLLVARDEPPAARYRTVSSADPALARVTSGWRVAFDPVTSAPAARELIEASGLRVLDGPSADNVYTVAPRDASGAAPETLRADPRVRLVEPLGASGAAP